MQTKISKIKTEVYTLPEHWAPALINGDFSGLSDSEEQEIKEFCEGKGSCLNCSEESFFKWRNDANNLGANCLEFTFIAQ